MQLWWTLEHWCRKEPNRIAARLYTAERNRAEARASSWCEGTQWLLSELQLVRFWERGANLPGRDKWTEMVVEALTKREEREWKKLEAESRLRGGSLGVFAQVKPKLQGRATYLEDLDVQVRHSLHRLRAETTALAADSPQERGSAVQDVQ